MKRVSPSQGAEYKKSRVLMMIPIVISILARALIEKENPALLPNLSAAVAFGMARLARG